MKKLLCVLLLLPLGGCMYQAVSGLELSAIVEMCKDKGGVRGIMSDFTGRVSGTCGNGSKVSYLEVDDFVYKATPVLITEGK